MGEHDDKVFLKRFSGIIVGLVIVTILIIVIAVGYDRNDPDSNPSRATMAVDRVQPVAAVRTELPAAEPVVEESTTPVTTEAVAIDGGAIYASTCLACHMTGAAGAPIPGGEGWNERAAKGLDTLASNAINGIGVMPPKGGRPDLSDEEITAAVQHMLDQ